MVDTYTGSKNKNCKCSCTKDYVIKFATPKLDYLLYANSIEVNLTTFTITYTSKIELAALYTAETATFLVEGLRKFNLYANMQVKQDYGIQVGGWFLVSQNRNVTDIVYEKDKALRLTREKAVKALEVLSGRFPSAKIFKF